VGVLCNHKKYMTNTADLNGDSLSALTPSSCYPASLLTDKQPAVQSCYNLLFLCKRWEHPFEEIVKQYESSLRLE